MTKPDRYLAFANREEWHAWLESNKQRAARLIAEGRMTAAGLQTIAEARQNDEWDAATSREDVDMIPDGSLQGIARQQAPGRPPRQRTI